ncbi:unnamed protein product, partial [Bubo scandiacus]
STRATRSERPQAKQSAQHKDKTWHPNAKLRQISAGSSNSPTWRKRKPHGKTCSRFKTTVQVVRVVRQWNRLPREGVESPSLGSQSLSAVFCNGFKLRKKGAVGLLCFLMANSGERNNNFYSKIAK